MTLNHPDWRVAMSAWELNKVTLSVKRDFKMIYICSSALLQHRELHYATSDIQFCQSVAKTNCTIRIITYFSIKGILILCRAWPCVSQPQTKCRSWMVLHCSSEQYKTYVMNQSDLGICTSWRRRRQQTGGQVRWRQT